MTDIVIPHASEASGPHPPRFRWLIRLTALCLVLMAAVASVRWWWGDLSSRRLNATINAVRARGERIVVADYAREHTLPDERNIAEYLRRAEKAAKFTKMEDWAISNADVLPLRDDIFQNVGEALDNHPLVFAELRAARDVKEADWKLNVVSPMWSVLLPHLNPLRQLANISRAASLHAAQRGDHAEAVEHVLDMSPVMRSLDDQPFLVTHLVRVGIGALASHTAAQLAHDLQIAGEDGSAPRLATTQPATRPASRQQVRALIAALLEDEPRHAAFQEALRGERAAQVDIGMTMARRSQLVRPAMELDALRLAAEGEKLVSAAGATDLPAARKLLPGVANVAGPRTVAHVVSHSVRPALGRAYSTCHRGVADARLAATALAIRMYQHDHGGARPPTLAALVPKYLPAVPDDPMGPAGTKIGYVADPVAPYVYSVGENGGDDSAGAPNVPPWRPDATSDRHKSPDLFLSLTRVNAPAPVIEDPPQEMDEPTEMLPATTAPAPTSRVY